jgi:SAM-dependent methyltransferase
MTFIDNLVLRHPRIGSTDLFHGPVERRGIAGKLYIWLFGTPHLGTFANGIYLRRLLRHTTFTRALDAGCGDGTFAFYLAQRFPDRQVVAVDIGEQGLHDRESTLEVCGKVQSRLRLHNLDFRQLDLRRMTDSNSFDLIYCFDVLEHIAENRQVLANMYRALTPGGSLLLRIPTRKQKRILSRKITASHAYWASIEHVGQHYEMDSLRKDLKEIGYERVWDRYTMGFWGRLSFELAEAFRYFRVPEAVLFLCTPALKLLRAVDTYGRIREGDGLLVLCRKPKLQHA